MAPSHVLRGCKRALNWFPVILVNLVVGWSYYAYVVELCVYTVPNNAERISYLVIFHVFFFMFLWSYWKTILVRPAFPSNAFCLPKAEKELYEKEENPEVQQEILRRVVRELPVYTQTAKGAIRYCVHCQIIKPDRTHHCSTCEMCVVKMDHHCPWVNTCVAWTNYKFFILFLTYGSLYCVVIIATVVQYFLMFWAIRQSYIARGQQQTENFAKFHIVFLFFVAVLFLMSMTCLLSYHLFLISKNRTTIEAFAPPVFTGSGPDINGYNLGFCRNVAEVFGEQKLSWFIPVFSSLGDGHSFVTRLVHIDPERANAILQQNGKGPGDGVDTASGGQIVSVKVEK